jgi:hypothetical protein
MAVIRERTQVFSQPVGVRRIDTGEQEVWRSISRSAEVFSEISHQRALENRTKEAEEAALAVPTSELFVLDSETGEPAILNTGENKGSVYAETYEKLINRRYLNSIDTEIAEKALEIAQRSPNSSVFKEEASRYVENMVKASAPDGERTQYTTVIEDAGKSIVGKMFADMQDKERKAIAARVKRDNKLMVAQRIARMEGLLEIGIDVSSFYNELSEEVGDLWQAGVITADQIVRLDKIGEGLSALSFTPSLISTYRESSQSQKDAIQLGIREPFVLEDLVASEKLSEDTAKAIRQALIGPASPSDLITALTSSETLEESLGEEAYDNFKEDNPISMLNTLESLKRYKQFGNEAYYDALQEKLNMSVRVDDVDSLAPKIAALSNQMITRQGLIDAGFTSANAETILELPFSERKDLTEYLDNFRIRFSKVENQNKKNKNTQAQTLVNNYINTTSAKDVNIFRSYNGNLSNLRNINLSPEDFKRYESQLFDEFSKKLQKSVALPQTTLEQLEQLNAAIQSNAPSLDFDATNEQQTYFDLINQLDETVRMRAHTKLITQRRAELKKLDDERNVQAAFTAIQEGRALSNDQQTVLDDHLYGKGNKKRVPDIFELASINERGEFLMDNKSGFLTRLSSGDILPSEMGGIISALQSTDSVKQNVAFDIMRQLYFAEQMSMDGTQSSRRNLLLTLQRNNENVFPKSLYNRVVTAMQVGNISLRKGISITPAEILNQIDRSDVNVEEVLRGTLNASSSEIYSKYGPSASKSGDRILPLMHPEARAQFAALMRYQAALGNPTNVDSLEEYFESFVDGLVEDERILPEYRVGEHTEYSLDIMTSAQQNKVYSYITKQFLGDPDYAELAKPSEVAKTIGMPRTGAGLGAIFNRKPEVAGVVKFMPLRESFLTENESWMVMIESDIDNVFIPATPNGIPMIINSNDFTETGDQKSLLIQSYTNSIFSASHANQPKAVAVYELKLDIIRNPERYDPSSVVESAQNLPMSGVFADQQLQGQVPKGKILGVEFEGVTGPSLRVGITNKRVSNYLTRDEIIEVYRDTLEEIKGIQ